MRTARELVGISTLFEGPGERASALTRLTSAAVMPSFLPPSSFLLSPVRVSCPERTFLKVRASEHGHGFSQPCAAFTPTRAHVMSCLIHDSRLTSAIDLGHTLPPCLSPYLATAALLDQASSLVVAPPCDVHACIYASMHHALMVNLGWE